MTRSMISCSAVSVASCQLWHFQAAAGVGRQLLFTGALRSCCCIAELKEYAKCLLATGRNLAARTPEQKGADADDPSRVVELSSQDLTLRDLPLPLSVRASKLVNRKCYDKLMEFIQQKLTHPVSSLVITGDLDQPTFAHALLVCALTRVMAHPLSTVSQN
jgi:hypothetical protein